MNKVSKKQPSSGFNYKYQVENRMQKICKEALKDVSTNTLDQLDLKGGVLQGTPCRCSFIVFLLFINYLLIPSVNEYLQYTIVSSTISLEVSPAHSVQVIGLL